TGAHVEHTTERVVTSVVPREAGRIEVGRGMAERARSIVEHRRRASGHRIGIESRDERRVGDRRVGDFFWCEGLARLHWLGARRDDGEWKPGNRERGMATHTISRVEGEEGC